MVHWKRVLLLCLFIFLISTLIYAQDILTYRVKRGDNLTRIARTFNTGIEKIIEFNGLKNPDLIRVNQLLKIPADNIVYRVKKGDFLGKIANIFKVSLERLIKVNKIKDADIIYEGQKLTIPPSLERERYQLASRSRQTNYIWPVHGRISSAYGWRIHPVRGKREFHTGLDIAVSMGSPVYAARDGVVTFSGWAHGYGNLVIIEHSNNQKTYYGHNLELLVEKGDTIKQGRIVSLSGNSGVSTGPHLHFEIRINGKHINPMEYLNQRYLDNGFRV